MPKSKDESAFKQAYRRVSITELLNSAKKHIATGENCLREAAEDIAAASEKGATQRVIAEKVGKSVGWVNGLLQWRQGGYQETPFGPAVRASRERAAAFSLTEQTEPATDQTVDSPFDPAKTRTIPVETSHSVIRFNNGKICPPETGDDTSEAVPKVDQLMVKAKAAIQKGDAATSKAAAHFSKAEKLAAAAASASSSASAPADKTAVDAAPGSDERPSISAIYQADAFKHVVEFPGALPEVIDLIGRENFLNAIATMQAAYDAHCEGSAVQAAADRAEAKPRPR
jgi:hypothetical protein